MSDDRACQPKPAAKPAARVGWLLAGGGAVGLASGAVAYWRSQPLQINLITYQMEHVASPRYLPALAFGLALMSIPAVLAGREALVRRSLAALFRGFAPLLLAVPLAASGYVQGHSSAWWVYTFILGAAWASGVAAASIGFRERRSLPGWLCVIVILAAIAMLTVVHTQTQRNFFEHFMLGHADIGHFTEHLKNVVAGRGLRSDSFPHSHFGVHFTPLMYLLAPGYALWPSPTYLMVMGPLLLHVPALIVYWSLRRGGAETGVALLLAVAWLLLPSLSRLVYCNTYAFQWTYFCLPFVAWAVAALCHQRWIIYWLSVAAVLLCQETFAAVVFGLGLYSLLFTRNRWAGVFTCGLAVAYLMLCTELIIPHFAVAGRYERIDLFGELGGSFPEVLASIVMRPMDALRRIARPESAHLLLLLLSSLALAPLRHWRLLIAAAPTLLFLLLLQNVEWLSIKFWHHAPVLPVIFAAAMYACMPSARAAKPGESRGRVAPDQSHSRRMGLAVAIAVAAAWGHYFFGFSPLSKPYEMYASDPHLSQPDPRFAFIEELRSRTDRRASVLATERMAAHFTDFAHIYTGRFPQAADLVVIDRSDTWDVSGLPSRAADFAADPAYAAYGEMGPVIVFRRKSESR